MHQKKLHLDFINDAQMMGQFDGQLTFNQWHVAGESHGAFINHILEGATPWIEPEAKEDTDFTGLLIVLICGAFMLAFLGFAMAYLYMKRHRPTNPKPTQIVSNESDINGKLH